MDTRTSKRRGAGGAGGGNGGVVGAAGVVSLEGGSWGGRQITSPFTDAPEHLPPGYGAGYDAGFLAGIRAASQGGALPPALPSPGPEPVAAEGGAGAIAPEPARPPLLAPVEDFPDLFQEVLERLDRVDRALLGRTESVVRAVVKRSGLPRVGGSAEEPRVGIAPFRQSLSLFVWAVANGCPWQCAATGDALAREGKLEVLQWASVHGCPLVAGPCHHAALGGHLEVLRWARRERQCLWDEDTCSFAAQGGHLEVLRWAREHDCPWDMMTCASAAENGHVRRGWRRRNGRCRHHPRLNAFALPF